MGTIISNPITASAAINELVGIDTSLLTNQQVEFDYTSDITGMVHGKEVSNQLLQAISDFSQAVLIQANKFPQVAAKLEKRDVEEAKRWSDL